MKTIWILFVAFVIGVTVCAIAAATPIGIRIVGDDLQMQGQPTAIDEIVFDYKLYVRLDPMTGEGIADLNIENAPFDVPKFFRMTEDIMHETGDYGWTSTDDYFRINFQGYSFMPASDPDNFEMLGFNSIEVEYFHPDYQTNFESSLESTMARWNGDSSAPEPAAAALLIVGGIGALCLKRNQRRVRGA